VVKPIFRKIQTINGERSFLIVLPKEYAKNLQLSRGDFVRVYQVDGKIIIENTFSENISKYGYGKFQNKKFSENLNKQDEKPRDYYPEEDGIEYWTKETVVSYCTDRIREILVDSSVNQKLVILMKFFSICKCVDKIEFMERIIDPILNKICNQLNLDYEDVKNKIIIELKEEF
jgi:bifunctional DNA-binding transcriptional regulator/antitoxin component of YhaV-PrlF toxin-antitoxin module